MAFWGLSPESFDLIEVDPTFGGTVDLARESAVAMRIVTVGDGEFGWAVFADWLGTDRKVFGPSSIFACGYFVAAEKERA